MTTKEEITQWFKTLQDNICHALEIEDGKGKFEEDNWKREGGGGGRTRILQQGNVIEKGGVNFSEVFSPPTPRRGEHPSHDSAPKELYAGSLPPLGGGEAFFATGVSIVIHPQSPMVPIIHMNVRYIEVGDDKWFGGGIDLTPHYVDEEDAKYFHRALKDICNNHHASYYDAFKKWADDYFFIKHRNETRGVGGIFFDHLKEENGLTLDERFSFVKAIGSSFAPIYTFFMKKNKDLPFSEKEKQWQYLRRGRYVEFNLVYDRGTKFGLETNGRAESILMSLPPQANWAYNYQTEKGSAEERTLSFLKKGIDWAAN